MKKGLAYIGLISAGAAAEYCMSARPLQERVEGLERVSVASESRAGELQRKLGRYSVRLTDGREMRLNPDMSVTVYGVGGDRTSDMPAAEYRKLVMK